jgi:hypothetical protein
VYEEESWVVSGTWFERRRGKFAAAHEYVLGNSGAVYTHLVFSTACELYLLSEANPRNGAAAVFGLDIQEEGRLIAARRHHAPTVVVENTGVGVSTS